MTIEDRLRATTEAVTAAMHPVRPLDLRSSAAADPAPARSVGLAGRPLVGLADPLAAAMAVIAVAATLVAVRSLSAAGPGSPPAPASPLYSGVPRYYVALGLMGRNGAPTQNAALADVSTGSNGSFSPQANMSSPTPRRQPTTDICPARRPAWPEGAESGSAVRDLVRAPPVTRRSPAGQATPRPDRRARHGHGVKQPCRVA